MAAGPRKPTLVLLVRHGQTPTTGSKLPGRAPGLHLADTGHAQAAAAAERIAVLPEVAAVYASPLERTRETAAPIARATGNRTRTHKGLLECDFGAWTGASLARLRKKREWATVQRYPSSFRFPGGESFKAALADALGTHLDLFQRLVVSPCSVSAVLYTETGPIVLATNSTGDDLRTLVPS
jgi:probable phosphoglycerate mutase